MHRTKAVPITQAVKDSVDKAIETCHAKAFGLTGNETDKEIELKRQRWYRDLTTPEFHAAINQAAQDNDFDFFRRLGLVLSEDPIPVPKPLPEKDGQWTLESLLIKFWLPGEQPSSGFCQMTDPLIAACLNHLLERKIGNKLLPDTIRKTWERLGLIKSDKPHLTLRSGFPGGPPPPTKQ